MVRLTLFEPNKSTQEPNSLIRWLYMYERSVALSSALLLASRISCEDIVSKGI